MAFIYTEYTNDAWSQDDPLIVAPISIKNYGSDSVVIKKVYIHNKITNPQEVLNIQNFCITLSDVDYYGLVGFDSMVPANYFIPYPNYYAYFPGNIEYTGIGYLVQSKFNYRLENEFTLASGEALGFKLNFNPRRDKIDFYRAELVIHYIVDGETAITKIKHLIKGVYKSNISEVDGKALPSVAISINGISTNNILIVQ